MTAVSRHLTDSSHAEVSDYPSPRQELVNLLVGGRAVPNVFDNDIELESGKGDVTLLKGIKSHCDVGLLSLFEHYNICKVRRESWEVPAGLSRPGGRRGSFPTAFSHVEPVGFEVGAYLKTPQYPIWLVCSESHFSVLFGLQRELLTSQHQGLQFDLYYYDGLANQQEEIRLTVCESAPLLIATLLLCSLTRGPCSHTFGAIRAASHQRHWASSSPRF